MTATLDVLAGDLRLPDLPYSKTDSVVDLDAVRAAKVRKPKPEKSAVPGRECNLSKICTLRKHGKCAALHCSVAAEYISSGEAAFPCRVVPCSEFHAHLDECTQCREHPFDLCEKGHALLIGTQNGKDRVR